MIENISYAAIYIVEALIAWQYFSYVFIPKHNKKTTGLLLVLSYSIMFAISRLDLFWLNTMSFFLGNLFCIYVLFEVDLKKSLFHTLVLTVAMNVTELVMIYILAWIYKDFSTFHHNFTTLIVLAVSSKILYYLVVLLVILFINGRKETSKHSDFIVVLLCCVPIITMWITLTFILVGFEGNIPLSMNWLVTVSALLLLLLNICVFFLYAYTQKTSHDHLQMQLQLQKETADATYYKMLLEQNDNQQILIHDIKKHLHSILDLLDHTNNLSANNYIQNLLQSEALKKKVHFCDQSTLNLILSRYREICQKKGIDFIVDIRKNTLDFMSLEDISALFGNLLENAVDSSAEVPNAYIELSIRQIESNQLLISMINSCSSVPKESSAGEYLSKKREFQKHGFGMRSIKKVVKKYHGSVNTYYSVEDQTFHTIITMCIIDSKK